MKYSALTVCKALCSFAPMILVYEFQKLLCEQTKGNITLFIIRIAFTLQLVAITNDYLALNVSRHIVKN